MVGGDRIELTVESADKLPVAREALQRLADGEIHLEPGLRRITVPVSDGSQALVDAIGLLAKHDVKIHDVGLRRPSLDDVFLTLTGHEAEETINGAGAAETSPDAEDRTKTEGNVR